MTTFARLNLGCLGLLIVFVAIFFFVLFWPLGIVLGLVGTVFIIGATENTGPQIIRRGSSPTVALEFGQSGPPVPQGTPPLQIRGMIIFPSAIRSITFYPPSPPDLQISPKGVTTSVPRSGRSHYSVMQLESLDEIAVVGQDDLSLRYWTLQYIPSTAGVSHGISLTDSEYQPPQ